MGKKKQLMPRALRTFAEKNGLRVYDVDGGYGVRFTDGCDVYWVLPEETWHFLNQPAAALSDDPVTRFQELDERRSRVLDALRRYLAAEEVAIDRSADGEWNTYARYSQTSVSVGPILTCELTRESDLGRALRSVFRHAHFKKPSPKQAARLLARYGQPFDERDWRDDDYDEAEDSFASPFVALTWMGLCKALKNPAHFDTPETLAKAAKPQGKVGAALLHFASRLPKADTSYNVSDGTMSLAFDDGYDAFTVDPRSTNLRHRIRAQGAIGAGDELADTYTRLNAGRSKILKALFDTLDKLGYVMDLETEAYVGRSHREFRIEVGEGLTRALEEGSEEDALRVALSGCPALAPDALAHLGRNDGTATLPKRRLAPVAPPPTPLPPISPEDARRLDERSEAVLRTHLQTKHALEFYADKLRWVPEVDDWASEADWLRLAKHHLDDRYRPLAADAILAEHGYPTSVSPTVEELQNTEPFFELDDRFVARVWEVRNKMPELGVKWFAPAANNPVPFSEVRAGLRDPVAGYDQLAIHETEDKRDHDVYGVVPHVLDKMPADFVRQMVGEARVNEWKAAAIQWAEEAWDWQFGGKSEVYSAAVHMGWTEVGEAFDRNPHIVPAVLGMNEEEPGIYHAGPVLLAWSRLAPSESLAQLVAVALRRDAEEFREWFRAVATQIGEELAEGWTKQAEITLAICWHRCRRYVGGNGG